MDPVKIGSSTRKRQTNNTQSPLVSQMLLATRKRDFSEFKNSIDLGFDVTMFVQSSRTGESVPFIEEVVRCKNADGVRYLMLDMQPCLIHPDHAKKALEVCVSTHGLSKIVAPLIEASLCGSVPFLNLSESFQLSIENYCRMQAMSAVNMPSFDPNRPGKRFGNAGSWEWPLLSAVRYRQYDIAHRLLQLGSQVDQPNYVGIKPLMMACGHLDVNVVGLLLNYGSNPNTVFNRVPDCALYPSTLNQCNSQGWSETVICERADKILQMLMAAGLRTLDDHWLKETSVGRNMTTAGSHALRMVVCSVPTLTQLSVAPARQVINKAMKGKENTGFNPFLNTLRIPLFLKERLLVDFLN